MTARCPRPTPATTLAAALLAVVAAYCTASSAANYLGGGDDDSSGTGSLEDDELDPMLATHPRGGKSSRAGTIVGVALLTLAALAVVLLRKRKTERWPDLVASPATFNKVLATMGVAGFKFVDVFDPGAIPADAVAVVVLQRYDPEFVPGQPVPRPAAAASQVYMPQVALGSCGTLSVINSLALSVLARSRGVRSRVPLVEQLLQGGGKPAHGTSLREVLTVLKECHYHAAGRPVAAEYATRAPRPDREPVRNHFVAFVPLTREHTYEVDPLKPTPVARAAWGGIDGGWAPAASAALRAKYHGRTADALGCLLALVPA